MSEDDAGNKASRNAIIDLEIASDRVYHARERIRKTGNARAIEAIEQAYAKVRIAHEHLTGEKDLVKFA